MTPRLGWYLRRLTRMSPGEAAWRVGTRLRQEAWAHRRFDVPHLGSPSTARVAAPGARGLGVPRVPHGTEPADVPDDARRALLRAANELLDGRGVVLGVLRQDMDEPDWGLDARSGRTFPLDRAGFRIGLHSPDDPRHVKQVWEVSRHHHLTVLAAAWWATRDERYAACVARQLRSWWAQNPVFMGVNWTSGIELGIRLLSWAWIRRLLGGWPGVSGLFEGDEAAAAQIYWHQRWLEAFPSRGSSANNHAVAEAAGWLVGSCAFPWFAESGHWRTKALARFERELASNTFPDGVNREQAFEYHGFVAEVALVAALEAESAGMALGDSTWALICRMLDVIAAVLDRSGGAPRQGDGDDGRGLVVDAPGSNRWLSLLAAGGAVFGPLAWWPPAPPDVRSTLVGGIVTRRAQVDGRTSERPSHFPDSGMTILRSPPDADEELWCRCDGGPHGFLAIAAHAHADALSLELRHDGVEILVDPGTYCYHGEPTWRRYFRSTLAHNTVELDGEDQSIAGGPFLWVRHARTEELEIAPDGEGPRRWTAEHHGYDRRHARASHRRRVLLDTTAGVLVVVDRLRTDRTRVVRLAFHLGPSVEAELDGHWATLHWSRPGGAKGTGMLQLPAELAWEVRRGETDPPLGWYSPAFGRKEPTTTLLGTGRVAPSEVELLSELRLGVPVPGPRGRRAAGVGGTR